MLMNKVQHNLLSVWAAIGIETKLQLSLSGAYEAYQTNYSGQHQRGKLPHFHSQNLLLLVCLQPVYLAFHNRGKRLIYSNKTNKTRSKMLEYN